MTDPDRLWGLIERDEIFIAMCVVIANKKKNNVMFVVIWRSPYLLLLLVTQSAIITGSQTYKELLSIQITCEKKTL